MFLILIYQCACFQIGKQLDVSLQSKWPKTSTIGESICFFGEFAKENYNCAIKQLNSLDSYDLDSNKAISIFSPCLSKEEQQFLNFSLTYNVFSPRIAFYTSIKSHDTIEKYNFEPNYEKFEYFDFKSKKNFKENTIIRPTLTQNANEQRQKLSGYGVELRPFKYSMEYSVKDPSQLQKGSKSIVDDPAYDYLEILDSEKEYKSDKKIHQHLESYIMNTEDPLHELKNAVENWPLSVKKVFNTEIEEGLTEDPGFMESYMTLNGRVIPYETFDPFTFASQIKEIKTIQKILTEKFGLTKKKAKVIMEKETHQNPLVIDARGDHILWINNLETDKRYSKYSKKVDSLFGRLNEPPKIRHNIVNMILFLDPASSKDMKLLLEIHKSLEKGLAVRVGISPIHTSKNEKHIKALYDVFSNYNAFKFVSSLVKGESIANAYEKTTNHKFGDFSDESDEFLATIDGFAASSGINETAVWTNGDFYNGQYLEDKLSIAPLEAIESAREVAMENGLNGDFLSLVLRHRHAIKRIVPEVSKVDPITTKMSQESYENIAEFVDFAKEIKYEKSDVEKPLCTAWLKVKNNKKEFEDNINDFFKSRHNTPVRFSFVERFPKIIENILIDDFTYDGILFVNGRVLYINSTFDEYDHLFSWQSSIVKQLQSVDIDGASDDLLFFWSSYILSLNSREIAIKHFHPNDFNNEEHFAIDIEGDEDIEIKAVVDPYTREGQKMISFLDDFSKFNIAEISIRVQPSKSITVPTSLYRYVTKGNALFSAFNDSITYSIILDTPETWMVDQKKVDTDVDNVLGNDLSNGYRYVFEYELSNIVVEGYSRDCMNHPSENIQIRTDESDTTIMSNNGYFQFKCSSPKVLEVNLASDWSKNNFKFVSDNRLVVSSFVWSHHSLTIKRTGDGQQNFKAVDDGKIHVFGVCSGKLYERLAKIMMLSVNRHANNATCKFWLLGNYLSPTFRKDVEKMSKIYNFEFQFVTYHWPHFVTRQSEKQRIIWGNKILFLDVLFPLSLSRVIYIDADQVVRTNMRELMTMDIDNSPYAFTPMCDSRLETEPFRFWHGGYWSQHLQGKKYHISALFMTDLTVFRNMKAGEALRDYYNSLVMDPESLANLDQDLPNYAQEKIPIYSLPQNWLWCETWCSDETMNDAKTIDLCNNPLTKAPKLKIAKERIQEWPELDKIASNIEEKGVVNDEL